ncbi:hypothetical protein QM306_39410, partial [Burkholderia cenocepacia]|nr:hypothetical protein [Burkholderia cenocepacia]
DAVDQHDFLVQEAGPVAEHLHAGIDGNRAFVGGHNVGVEYLGAKPRLSPWRDTHIEIRGPVVASIQYVFAEDWHWATQKLPPIAL